MRDAERAEPALERNCRFTRPSDDVPGRELRAAPARGQTVGALWTARPRFGRKRPRLVSREARRRRAGGTVFTII